MGFDTREERKAYKLGIEKAEARLTPEVNRLERRINELLNLYHNSEKERTNMAHTVEEYAGEQQPPFKVGDSVIYEGKSYSFPGEIVSVDKDGAYTVKAFGFGGYYGGMKHIYGPGVLKPFDLSTADKNAMNVDRLVIKLEQETIRANGLDQSLADMRDALNRTREKLETVIDERNDAEKRALDRESTINTFKNEYDYISKVANDRFVRIEEKDKALGELRNIATERAEQIEGQSRLIDRLKIDLERAELDHGKARNGWQMVLDETRAKLKECEEVAQHRADALNNMIREETRLNDEIKRLQVRIDNATVALRPMAPWALPKN